MAFELETALDVLRRTPATLRCWLSGLSTELLAADEGPDTFSPHDVLGHLVQGEEEDWLARARIVLEAGEERAFDPFDRFAFRERYAGRTTAELLDRFEGLRGENLEALRALSVSPTDLDRRGRHPELGPVTLRELLATWVVHDLSHLAQIARVLAKHHAADVGPWRAYLPILDRP